MLYLCKVLTASQQRFSHATQSKARELRAPLRGGSQLARFYPRCHLRAGSACAIHGASSPNANILLALLFPPRLKLKTDKILFFGFDLQRHIIFQPNRGMKARIRRQGCRRKNGGAMDKFAGSKFEQRLRWPRRGEAQGCAEYPRLPFVP